MRNVFLNIIVAAAVAVGFSAPLTAVAASAPAVDTDRSTIDRFIDSLMSKMTLEGKIGQLNLPVSGILTGDARSNNVAENIRTGRTGGVFGVRGAANCRELQKIAVEESRLGIPLIFGLDVIHGYETTFPIPLAQAASWNMEKIAQASEIAKAMVQGYQGSNLADPSTVMACVKHYALYGAPEGGRDYNTVDMSRQTAMNDYMPPYKAAAEAGAGSFMASFNEFESIPATANSYLINDVLRKQWGYDGFVVTDYTGIMEMIMHGIGDYAAVAARALNAGIDMDMVSEAFNRTLASALEGGQVSQEQIDTACRRILTAKYLLGLFDDPYRYCDPSREGADIYTKANRRAARDMAVETFVLLKNDGNLLPLGGKSSVALIGPLGDSPANMPGMWSVPGGNAKPVSLLAGLKSVLGKKVKYARGCNALDDAELENKVSPDGKSDRDPRSEAELSEEALRLAEGSDVIVAAMGELMNMTGEGASRADITLPAPQRRLLDKLVATGKPVVLVLFTGRPLVLTDVAPEVGAILNVWFAGTEAGDAIADVLTGKVAPSGKLPVSFPYHIGQIPVHYNHKNTGRPMPEGFPYIKYRSNYQDIPNDPLYPFGYGLSYTTFDYSAPTVDKTELSGDEELTVSVDVTNSGKCTAKETVQLYIRDVAASSTRPVKELKGFRKLELAPGQSENVKFKINRDLLSFYNHDLEYVCEPGEFELMVGPDSKNVKSVKITVK